MVDELLLSAVPAEDDAIEVARGKIVRVDEEIAAAAVAKHQIAVVTYRCKRHARVSGCQNAVIDPLGVSPEPSAVLPKVRCWL